MSDQKPKNTNLITRLRELSLGEIEKVASDALEKDEVFHLSLPEVGEFFLKEIHKTELLEEDLRDIAILIDIEEPTSDNKDYFFISICEHYLNIDKAPRDALINNTKNVNRDLRKIKENIMKIEKEEEVLENTKKTRGYLDGEERYFRNRLKYYKEKNKKAREQIIDYMTDDIYKHSLNDCSQIKRRISLSYGAIMGDMPYQFSRGALFSHKDPYDFRDLTKLSNKFYNLPVGTHKQIVELFHENPADFYEFAENYLIYGLPGNQGDESGIDEIREKTNSNHILHKRKDIIEAIIKHFKNQDYISVSNITPMQIEGIFHDICVELGIPQSKLDISSINNKLEILHDSIEPFIYFEYYYFIFPVTRNLVAHGRLIDNDARHTAIMLMLDLLPVCELAGNEKIPAIEAMRKIDDALENNFESAVDWAKHHINTQIPNFYEFNDRYQKFKDLLTEDDFWSFMEDRAIKEETKNIKDTETKKVAQALKSFNIAEKHCLEFLKKTGQLQIKKDDAEKKRQELRNLLLGK